MPSRRSWALPLMLVAIGVAAPAAQAADGRYSAEIRRTTGGVPHVKAGDWGSLGFGYGYAYAQDNLCTLADILVTINAQRSRYFGPDATYGEPPNPINNLKSDFFFQRIKDMRTVERLAARRFPHGPAAEVRAVVRGMAAGYNSYLRKTGRDRLPDPRCRGKAWVRPITALDLYRRFYQLGIRASSGNFLREIVDAKPPGAAAARAAQALPGAEQLSRRLASDPVLGDQASLGSNGYAIGRDASETGQGLVLGNPHFPWNGSERWYEIHLTLPGKVDAIGAALQGAPVVNIGFNKDVAWTHTVSTARRFTPYELKLVQGNPLRYRYGNRTLTLAQRRVRVRVRGGGTRAHTFYESRWGPVLDYPAGTLTWTNETAYAIADVNADNFRLTNQWAEWMRASSVADFRRAYARVQGNPWVNVIVADRRGNAYYSDESVVPNVDAARAARCSVGPRSDLLLSAGGVILLDGSKAECRWANDRDAVAPGIIGPRGLPRLQRSDYVANANDSYWLANPRRLLTGFQRTIGPEATARSLRTRLVFMMAEERLSSKFSVDSLQELLFSDRNLSGELARDATVAACRAAPSQLLGDGRTVDISQACEVLAGWDLRGNVDSRGAVLWREYWDRVRAISGGVPWTVQFDPANSVGTPSSLDTARPEVLQGLATAVQDLRDKGIALDVALGELQAEPRGDERIPIHGCTGAEGCANVIQTVRGADGRYDPYTGSSFIMAAGFRNGRPEGEAILTYSQSENPESPHYADQTRLYSRKEWLPMRFTDEQIRADPNFRRTVVSASR